MTHTEKIDCLLVTGMHRSGVSLMAGCLKLLGVDLGQNRQETDFIDATELPGVNDVAVIHDILLRDLGCKWDMIGNLPDGWLESDAADSAKTRIGNFIENRLAANRLWAIADPRLCRLMPLWDTILGERHLNPAFVVTIRHPWEVAQSLKMKSGMDVQHAHLLWLASNKAIFDFCQQRPNMVTTNDQLIADPATVLYEIAEQFGLMFPLSLQDQYHQLLDFVRPELKHHHLGGLYKDDHQRQAFSSFSWLYEQIYNYRATARLLAQESSEKGVPEEGSQAVLPTCFSTDMLPFIGDQDFFKKQVRQEGSQLFRQFLSLIGQYEREERKLQLRKTRRILNATQGNDTLFARIYLPSLEKKHEDDDNAQDCLLFKGEWQQVRFQISNPDRLRSQPLRLAPLNTKGAVHISAIRIVNVITNAVCWEMKEPSDFESIQLKDALRLPDRELLCLMTYTDSAFVTLPILPELPDCPVEFQAWLKVDNRQDKFAAAWSDILKQNKQLETKLDESRRMMATKLQEWAESEKENQAKETSLRNNLHEANQELGNHRGRIAELQKVITDVKEQKSYLEKQAAAASQQLADLQTRISELESQVPNVTGELTQHKDRMTLLQSELAEVHDQKRTSEEKLSSTVDELWQKQRRMTIIEKQGKESHTLFKIALETYRERLTALETEKSAIAFKIKKSSATELVKNRLSDLKKHVDPKHLFQGKQDHTDLTSFFDRQWYLNTYASVIDKGIDPLKHYLVSGYKQGCNPNPLFHNDWYIASNPDILESNMNPLVHYVNYGKAEGRFTNPLFDGDWYIENYPDVADSGVDPLMHFLKNGAQEGRNPNPLFFTQWYLDTYPDVAASGINPLVHYLDNGVTEGRDPNPLFDTDWYLATYPDVAEAKVNPLAHFITFGVQDGRDPNPLFDTDWYLATYPDVAQEGINPLVHFLNFGVLESRDPNPLFDTDWYLSTYPEVEKEGLNPLAHYLRKGCLGDYNPNPFFDSKWYLKAYIDPSDMETNPLAHYLYVGAEAGYTAVSLRRPYGSESDSTPSATPLPETPAFEKTESFNLLFVLHNQLASNSGYQVYYHAKRLFRHGVNCIIAVPEKEQNFEDFDGSVVCPVLSFKDIEKVGLPFINGRGPDIVHAWTPREHVRKFCSQLKKTYAFRTIVHLEDNEEYLTASAVGKDWDELEKLPKEMLDQIVPEHVYHPIHGPQWLKESNGLTMVTNTLEKYNYANVQSLVIMPTVDEKLFYPRPINWKLRHELEIPDDHVVLVYTGNVHSANQEEVGELYKAVELLNQKGCATSLIRTGRNKEAWPWNNSSSLNGFVKEMGWVKRKELPDILAAADIFVQPGKPGPFNDYRIPSKLPEYFASGRPVILPKTNWGLEVRHNQEAIILENSNCDTITEAILKISNDKKFYEQMSQAAVDFLSTKTDSFFSVEDLNRWYTDLIDDHESYITIDLQSNEPFPVLNEINGLPSYDIPIVVVAYNRPESFSRLLRSLNTSIYHRDVDLLISIDGGIENRKVAEIANKFDWKYGVKKVIVHEHNIGLKNHILKSCDLSQDHDGIIVLEDDLLVSPVFYSYAQQAFDYYRNDSSVAGIALYTHSFNETASLPFTPIQDHSDVFFMQVPCSWGTLWTKDQWKQFKGWMDQDTLPDRSKEIVLPGDVLTWPESSWKKKFFKYIIKANKYIVYPRVSLTTNFGDKGKHMIQNQVFQVPFRYGDKKYDFIDADNSIAKYDAFCEILPETINFFNNNLSLYDYCVDLYGMKPKEILKDIILTSKPTNKKLASFPKNMIPLETNMFYNLIGYGIHFVDKNSCISFKSYDEFRSRSFTKNNLLYFYNIYEETLDKINTSYYPKKKELKENNCDDLKNIEEIKGENELLLIQLHHVQEELEKYYIKYHELKKLSS